MKKKIKKKPFEWHYVYRGINAIQKEVYHGISIDTKRRINGSHCKGGTKALTHWTCETEVPKWAKVSRHKTQAMASKVSHKYERTFKKRGYTNIITAGK